jgi:hypothetical protein
MTLGHAKFQIGFLSDVRLNMKKIREIQVKKNMRILKEIKKLDPFNLILSDLYL